MGVPTSRPVRRDGEVEEIGLVAVIARPGRLFEEERGAEDPAERQARLGAARSRVSPPIAGLRCPRGPSRRRS